MLYLDSTLSKNFRYYDAQIKWQAPGGLTVSQLADALYSQWLLRKDIKERKGVTVTRESALNTVVKYLQLVFGESVADYSAPLQENPAPTSGRSRSTQVPRLRRRCCGG